MINSKSLQIGGHRLSVKEITGELPLIIFLHEALGSIGQWKDFPEALCGLLGNAGFVYERAGYGKSEGSVLPRPDDFLSNVAVEELHKVVQAISPDAPVILYGHSDGGSIALSYAIRYPDRVLALVSEAAHVFVEQQTVEGVIPVKEMYEAGMRQKLEKYHDQKVDDVFFGWWDTWQRESFLKWDIRYQLKYISCPVLVIQGELDQYGTKEQVEEIQNRVPGPCESIIIPSIGHHPHREARSIVLDSVYRYLRDLEIEQLIHQRRLEGVYHAAPINTRLKPRLIVGDATAKSYMPADPDYFHAGGGMHGAFYFKVLDDTAYFACQSVEKEYFLLTGEFSIRFLKPITGGEVYAEGRLLEQNGKKYVAEAKLYWNGELAGEGVGVFLRSKMKLDELKSYGGGKEL